MLRGEPRAVFVGGLWGHHSHVLFQSNVFPVPCAPAEVWAWPVRTRGEAPGGGTGKDRLGSALATEVGGALGPG